MRTSLVVNTSRFRHNIRSIREQLAPQTLFLAVVKADAYGHGAAELAKVAEDEKVDYFGVATVDEAVELRETGIVTPILMLTEPTDVDRVQAVLYYNITLSVYTQSFLADLSKMAAKFGKPARVHLKVDTGMSRVGVDPDDVLTMVNLISQNPYLQLEGVFSHFSDADGTDDTYSRLQMDRFKKVTISLKRHHYNVAIYHIANSAATLRYPESHYDMVRVGIALYKGVLTFATRVIHVKTLPADTPIGYGKTYITPKAMRIAVLSVGYADGYSRLLSGKGEVLIHGRRCPLVGRVCMDMTTVAIPDDLVVNQGDAVTLIGAEGDELISAESIANRTQTIDYEVMCSIGKRVPRLYR